MCLCQQVDGLAVLAIVHYSQQAKLPLVTSNPSAPSRQLVPGVQPKLGVSVVMFQRVLFILQPLDCPEELVVFRRYHILEQLRAAPTAACVLLRGIELDSCFSTSPKLSGKVRIPFQGLGDGRLGGLDRHPGCCSTWKYRWSQRAEAEGKCVRVKNRRFNKRGEWQINEGLIHLGCRIAYSVVVGVLSAERACRSLVVEESYSILAVY